METTAKGLAPFVVGCGTAGGARMEPSSELGTLHPILVAGEQGLDAAQSSGFAPFPAPP
jgi:hypothetical protein